MNITATGLTKAAGAAPRPPAPSSSASRSTTRRLDVAHVVTTEMAVRETAEGGDGRPGAGRHHRHVPAPPPPVRRPRAGRLPAAQRRLPRHLRTPVHRRLRPPDLAGTDPGYVQDLIDAADGRQPERRHRRACRTLFLAAGHRLHGSAACCSASPCSAPASWPAGPPRCSPSAPPPPLALPCCRSPSTGRSPCPTASR